MARYSQLARQPQLYQPLNVSTYAPKNVEGLMQMGAKVTESILKSDEAASTLEESLAKLPALPQHQSFLKAKVDGLAKEFDTLRQTEKPGTYAFNKKVKSLYAGVQSDKELLTMKTSYEAFEKNKENASKLSAEAGGPGGVYDRSAFWKGVDANGKMQAYDPVRFGTSKRLDFAGEAAKLYNAQKDTQLTNDQIGQIQDPVTGESRAYTIKGTVGRSERGVVLQSRNVLAQLLKTPAGIQEMQELSDLGYTPQQIQTTMLAKIQNAGMLSVHQTGGGFEGKSAAFNELKKDKSEKEAASAKDFMSGGGTTIASYNASSTAIGGMKYYSKSGEVTFTAAENETDAQMTTRKTVEFETKQHYVHSYTPVRKTVIEIKKAMKDPGFATLPEDQKEYLKYKLERANLRLAQLDPVQFAGSRLVKQDIKGVIGVIDAGIAKQIETRVTTNLSTQVIPLDGEGRKGLMSMEAMLTDAKIPLDFGTNSDPKTGYSFKVNGVAPISGVSSNEIVGNGQYNFSQIKNHYQLSILKAGVPIKSFLVPAEFSDPRSFSKDFIKNAVMNQASINGDFSQVTVKGRNGSISRYQAILNPDLESLKTGMAPKPTIDAVEE